MLNIFLVVADRDNVTDSRWDATFRCKNENETLPLEQEMRKTLQKKSRPEEEVEIYLIFWLNNYNSLCKFWQPNIQLTWIFTEFRSLR